MTSLPVILSSGFVPSVAPNDTVKAGQIIAKKVLDNGEHIVNLAQEFSASIDKVRKYLRKKPGDSIEKGEILAVKKNLFGLSEEKVISKVSGAISRYERDSGNLIIKTESGANNFFDMVSPVDGIVAMCDNEKIVLSTDKDVYYGSKAAGGDITGEIYIIEDALPTSRYYAIDSRGVGKIIVGRNFARDILIKSIGIGAIGIVGTEMKDEDINYLRLRKMQIPIIEVDNNTIEKIIQWKGKRLYLNSQEKIVLFLHA